MVSFHENFAGACQLFCHIYKASTRRPRTVALISSDTGKVLLTSKKSIILKIKNMLQ